MIGGHHLPSLPPTPCSQKLRHGAGVPHTGVHVPGIGTQTAARGCPSWSVSGARAHGLGAGLWVASGSDMDVEECGLVRDFENP